MGTYEDLKNAIADVIYANGNNEITGTIMQQVLQRIVSVIGVNATFAGIATPQTNPGEVDQNVIYVATQPGIYTNFNGVNITSGIGIFSNKSGVWDYIDLGLQLDMFKNISYSELVAIRNSAKLTPGILYRITDYITTTTQADTQSAGHPFDVIVLALSESELSEQAWAVHSERDTDGYFANSRLYAWKIWYYLDNDTSRFTWADATNGKGIIYRMIDEKGNDCPYDFKNIQFRHPYEQENPKWYYTFSVDGSMILDHSIYVTCHNNIVHEYFVHNAQSLNRNVFQIEESGLTCRGNILGVGCHLISFSGSCSDNILGDSCADIRLVGGGSNNVFGGGCISIHLTRGSRNIFGSLCQYITLGDNNYNNVFNGYCSNIVAGTEFHDNWFGNICENFTIGNLVRFNTFGNKCKDINIVNRCVGNRMGNDCRNNSIGQPNTVATQRDYQHNVFEDGVSACTLTGTGTASSNNQVQNVHIMAGVSGTIDVQRNRAYETTVAVDSSGNVKQFCIADLA